MAVLRTYTGGLSGATTTYSYNASGTTMIICVMYAGGWTINNITFNGAFFTRQGVTDNQKMQIWTLVNPSQGTYNLVVSATTSSGAPQMSTVMSSTATIVRQWQATEWVTNGASCVFTAVLPDDLIIGAIKCTNNTGLLTGETNIWGSQDRHAYMQLGAAGNVTFGFTFSGTGMGPFAALLVGNVPDAPFKVPPMPIGI